MTAPSPRHVSPRHVPLTLFAIMAISVTGQSYLLVVLPALGRLMGFSDLATGSILSLSALLLICAAPVWGQLSERIGRRPVMLAALAASAVTTLAYSLVVTARLDAAVTAGVALALFLTARILQALFVSGLLPAVQAYIADITAPELRVGGMGIIGAAYAVGAIGGSLLATGIGGQAPGTGFLIAATLLAAAGAGVLGLIPKPARHAVQATAEEVPDPLVTRIWPFMLITFFGYAAYGVMQQVISLRLEDALGFSTREAIAGAGTCLLVTALAMAVMQGLVVRRLTAPAETLLVAGAGLAALSMLACTLVHSYAALLAGMVLFGAAIGLVVPSNLALLSLRAGRHVQGKAAGLNVIGQGLGLALGPVAGAALHQVSPAAPFAAATLLLACATGLAVAVRRAGAAAPAP